MASEQKEGAAEAEEADQDGAKPKSKRRLVLIAVAVLVLLGGGAGGYFFLMSPKDEAMAKAGTSQKDSSKGKDDSSADADQGGKDERYVVAPFKEIIVNITSITARGQATSRFLKLNIALVYDPKAEGADRLSERQVFIRDAYIEFLRQLSENDLNGSAGLAQLKGELLHRARLLAETDALKEILIADMVIQ